MALEMTVEGRIIKKGPFACVELDLGYCIIFLRICQ